MTLTETTKSYIDALDYETLLRRWRFGLPGNKWFQGESGTSWKARMEKFRDEGIDHAAISKKIGWVKK